MPYSPRVKDIAYKLDPGCWHSYSGCSSEHKRRMDARRTIALGKAVGHVSRMGGVVEGAYDDFDHPEPKAKPMSRMPPMKISMMLHFHYQCEGYPNRYNTAYRNFRDELQREGMIRAVTSAERAGGDDSWIFMATDKGRVYVEALCAMPLPVRAEAPWVMPASGGAVE